MSGIVCAIRGGPASQPTIFQAIDLAREKSLPLYFVYIVDIEFLRHTSHVRSHTILAEMRQMGEFILLTAQTKAEAQGVMAQGVVREGVVSEQIVQLCREKAAGFVIMGRPAETETDVFTAERLLQFGQKIEQETGAAMIFAEETNE
ncbi:MAG: universal stress protein, partial [Anaerolineae bacterium]